MTDDDAESTGDVTPGRARRLTDRMRAFAAMVAAGGVTYTEAYCRIYGSKNRKTAAKAATRLANHPAVKPIIQGIKEDAGKALGQIVANDLALDRGYVLANLKEVVERCMTRAPVLDKSGKQVFVTDKDGERRAAFTFDSKGANQALALIGKELGMFVERREVRHGPLAQASDEEIDAELAAITKELSMVTGKPVRQLLVEASRAELAIDVTPREAVPALAANDDDPTPRGGA